jgi:hypothetical protein
MAEGYSRPRPVVNVRSALAILARRGRIAQRESARFTRERSLVRSQVRPLSPARSGRGLARSPALVEIGRVGWVA